jgi:SET domain-containing protein
MLIKTKIGPSKIHGTGLFADEFIPEGTLIWKFTQEEISKLPKAAQEYLGTYIWLSKKSNKYCFSVDNGKYFNHSDNPNSLSAYYDNEEEVVTKAIKNIQPREEITDNYSSFTDELETKKEFSSNKS